MLSIESPLPQFFDLDGSPLDAGSLYFGTAGANPETSPVTVYWDAAGTQPAAQPIKTMNGYAVRSGMPAKVYVTGDVSLTVKDKFGRLVYYSANNSSAGNAVLLQAQIDAFHDDTSPANGDALIAVKRIVPPGVATTLHNWIEGRRIGARSDLQLTDGADVTTALQSALNSMSMFDTLDLEGLSAEISNTLTLPVDYINVTGPGKLKAKAGAQFEYMMLGTSRTGVTVRDMEFDANQANRTAGQSIRFMGAGFSSCTDCSFLGVTVRNTRGYNNVSAVGLVAAGQSTRCMVLGCKLIDCGVAGNVPATDSDGVFTSGTQNLIYGCIGSNCSDVSFVIENSNFSGIAACTSLSSYCGAAITCSGTDDKRGNFISGLTISEWEGANTGGLCIGTIGSGAGNLYDSLVANVTLYVTTPTRGNGPAFYVRQGDGGKTIGVTVTGLRVRGGNNQGVVASGDDIHFISPNIRGTVDSCIQFQGGSNNTVEGGVLSGGSYGVITQNTATATVKGATTSGQYWGQYYAFDTSTLKVRSPDAALTPTVYGNDSGAKIEAATTGRHVTVAYSSSMTIDPLQGDTFIITATNNTAFTINTPANQAQDQTITIRVRNGSGGSLGAVTWGTGYKLASWTNPAVGHSRSITFRYNGADWIETNRTTVDIPN